MLKFNNKICRYDIVCNNRVHIKFIVARHNLQSVYSETDVLLCMMEQCRDVPFFSSKFGLQMWKNIILWN